MVQFTNIAINTINIIDALPKHNDISVLHIGTGHVSVLTIMKHSASCSACYVSSEHSVMFLSLLYCGDNCVYFWAMQADSH